MPKILLLAVFFCFFAALAKGQENFTIKGDSLKRDPVKTDTAKKYINLGRIAGRKAAIRSALIPGWGQYSNGLTVYRGIKIAAIYTGGVMLGMSFVQNNNKYHEYLAELQYRNAHNRQSPPGSILAPYSYDGLVTAKDTYRRNKEVVIFSFIGLYAVNIIEAYVDARLSYFDIGDNLAIKVSPSMINSGTMYGFNNSFTPALKFSFRL